MGAGSAVAVDLFASPPVFPVGNDVLMVRAPESRIFECAIFTPTIFFGFCARAFRFAGGPLRLSAALRDRQTDRGTRG